ncbi:MAG TPA: hypothetical protein VFW71_11730 [Actinomycetota bacterium]|nr:hypothetical protein [Actinomycetota bacterium]
MAPVIRLGVRTGFSFQGPAPLRSWQPPDSAGVFAVLLGRESGPSQYSVIDVGYADNLRTAGWRDHPHAPCWSAYAMPPDSLFVAWLLTPGGSGVSRIATELIDGYGPPCADGGFFWESAEE